MIWGGWVPPPVSVPPPPPRVSQPVKSQPPKPKSIRPRFEEWIDVEMANAVIDTGNGLELSWLKELLEDGVKVRNVTGRFLKVDRFLQSIEEKQKAAMPATEKVEEDDLISSNPTFVSNEVVEVVSSSP